MLKLNTTFNIRMWIELMFRGAIVESSESYAVPGAEIGSHYYIVSF